MLRILIHKNIVVSERRIDIIFVIILQMMVSFLWDFSSKFDLVLQKINVDCRNA